MDELDVFSRFDGASFPCTAPDPTYGGVGSKFTILERVMAFDHALTNDALPGSSNHGTMDCPCVTNSGVVGRPCSMSLPGFMPHIFGPRLLQTSLVSLMIVGLPLIHRLGIQTPLPRARPTGAMRNRLRHSHTTPVECKRGPSPWVTAFVPPGPPPTHWGLLCGVRSGDQSRPPTFLFHEKLPTAI